jgi:hypothetical protein
VGYSVSLYLHGLTCREPESLTTKDIFACLGSVVVDGISHGFATEPMAIGRGEIHDMGGYPTGPGELFNGICESARIGSLIRGYDIDDNDQ